MSAQDSPGLAGVWDLLRATRQQDLAPVLIRHGVRSVDEISSISSELLEEGVAPWKIELLQTAGAGDPPDRLGRWDMPVTRQNKRASMQAALDAALPNNRRRCIEALEKDVLAHSTQPSVDSKVRTYLTICQAWQVAPWPVSLESVQCFGASLKEGAYKSAQGFFQAVFTHQRRHHLVEVNAVIRGAAKDYVRSISRG